MGGRNTTVWPHDTKTKNNPVKTKKHKNNNQLAAYLHKIKHRSFIVQNVIKKNFATGKNIKLVFAVIGTLSK